MMLALFLEWISRNAVGWWLEHGVWGTYSLDSLLSVESSSNGTGSARGLECGVHNPRTHLSEHFWWWGPVVNMGLFLGHGLW